LIRARIIVEGDVQKVGYRDFVQKAARRLGVKGYVENMRDGSVQIVCEAEEAVLNSFLKEINVKEDFIRVERIRVVEKTEASGEFETFEIKYGRLEEELGDRLGTAVAYAAAMYTSIKEMHGDVKNVHRDLEDMHGSMKDMHRDLKGAITEMHSDLKGTITDMRKDIKGAITEMHTDLKGTITDMHRDLKGGITGVQSEIGSMRREINDGFEEMARRYDAISAELVRTREELTRAVDALLKLIEEFIRERREEEGRRRKRAP